MFSKKKLYAAVKEGNPEKVRKFAKKSTAMHTDEGGYNTFTHAALLGNAKVMTALLEAGINPNVRDKKDRTALFVAALCDRGEVAKVLVNYESDPPIEIDAKCTDSQKTALEAAIESESNSVVNVLGKVAGQWLLQAAKENDAVKVRELLKRPGLNPDVTDITGWTALHFAMKNGNELTVEDLAAAGADAHVKNRKGETPIDIATDLGNMAIVKQFERIFNITGKKTREEMEEHFKESDAPAVGIVPQHLQQEFIKEAQKKKKESPAATPPRRTGPLNVSVKGGWTQGAPTVGIDEELARELAAMGLDLTARSPRGEEPPVIPEKPAQHSARAVEEEAKPPQPPAKPQLPAKPQAIVEKSSTTEAEEKHVLPAKRPSEKQAQLLKLSAFAASKKKREAPEEAPTPGLASSGGASPRRPSPRRPTSPRVAGSPEIASSQPDKPTVSPILPPKIPVVSPRVMPTVSAPLSPGSAPTVISPRVVAVEGEGNMPVEMAITDSLMSLYSLEEQLTKLEEEPNKALLTQTIKQVRSLAINLKNFSALEECKTGDNAENMAKLRDGIKAAVARIKGLS